MLGLALVCSSMLSPAQPHQPQTPTLIVHPRPVEPMALSDHISSPHFALFRLLLLSSIFLLFSPSVALRPPLAGRRAGWSSQMMKPGRLDTCRIVMLGSLKLIKEICRERTLTMRSPPCRLLEMHCLALSGSFSSGVQELQRFERQKGRIHVLWAMRLLPQWRLLPSTFRVPFFVAEADFPLANMVSVCLKHVHVD